MICLVFTNVVFGNISERRQRSLQPLYLGILGGEGGPVGDNGFFVRIRGSLKDGVADIPLRLLGLFYEGSTVAVADYEPLAVG
ncbi:hypothetical protein LH464_21495 [Neorhizobium sp. T786]|uniref:hypothetical protein n=1 Tax=Pseudorhizobium xiangyangii TaxID=2883104 RepID=UPI001CFFC314|nr:hypothetical protein [Neorhizobium xiangyangii]MCB5205044.1 hypothetical protein [Neorhizobium xiangyangii]